MINFAAKLCSCLRRPRFEDAPSRDSLPQISQKSLNQPVQTLTAPADGKCHLTALRAGLRTEFVPGLKSSEGITVDLPEDAKLEVDFNRTAANDFTLTLDNPDQHLFSVSHISHAFINKVRNLFRKKAAEVWTIEQNPRSSLVEFKTARLRTKDSRLLIDVEPSVKFLPDALIKHLLSYRKSVGDKETFLKVLDMTVEQVIDHLKSERLNDDIETLWEGRHHLDKFVQMIESSEGEFTAAIKDLPIGDILKAWDIWTDQVSKMSVDLEGYLSWSAMGLLGEVTADRFQGALHWNGSNEFSFAAEIDAPLKFKILDGSVDIQCDRLSFFAMGEVKDDENRIKWINTATPSQVDPHKLDQVKFKDLSIQGSLSLQGTTINQSGQIEIIPGDVHFSLTSEDGEQLDQLTLERPDEEALLNYPTSVGSIPVNKLSLNDQGDLTADYKIDQYWTYLMLGWDGSGSRAIQEPKVMKNLHQGVTQLISRWVFEDHTKDEPPSQLSSILGQSISAGNLEIDTVVQDLPVNDILYNKYGIKLYTPLPKDIPAHIRIQTTKEGTTCDFELRPHDHPPIHIQIEAGPLEDLTYRRTNVYVDGHISVETAHGTIELDQPIIQA